VKPWVIIILVVFTGCSPALFKYEWTQETAPRKFYSVFETTHGKVTIESMREWAPNGVDRLYQLISHDFYKNAAIYRVVPGQVEFGVAGDTLMNYAWRSIKVKNDPVTEKNTYGCLSFVPMQDSSISTILVINTDREKELPYPVVGRVTEGMDDVLLFFQEYGEEPARFTEEALINGNTYWQINYPELDYIQKSYLLKY
jgi:cyclophilin family peptidyl-prolyl cis-trans isomerase